MSIFLVFVIIGLVAGLLYGMLGIGGGVVIVPALLTFLPLFDFPVDHLMNFATGTTLAAMSIIALSTGWQHHKKGAVVWDLWKRLAPNMAIGVLLGVVLASRLSTPILQQFFALFLSLIGIRMIFFSKKVAIDGDINHSIGIISIPGMFIGTLAGMFGLSGGLLLIPYLAFLQVPMPKATATSVMCTFPTMLMGTFAAMLVGSTYLQAPQYVLGYVYWPAAVCIGLVSLLSIPVGVYLAHRLPVGLLKKVFGLIVLIVAFKMSNF